MLRSSSTPRQLRVWYAMIQLSLLARTQLPCPGATSSARVSPGSVQAGISIPLLSIDTSWLEGADISSLACAMEMLRPTARTTANTHAIPLNVAEWFDVHCTRGHCANP